MLSNLQRSSSALQDGKAVPLLLPSCGNFGSPRLRIGEGKKSHLRGGPEGGGAAGASDSRVVLQTKACGTSSSKTSPKKSRPTRSTSTCCGRASRTISASSPSTITATVRPVCPRPPYQASPAPPKKNNTRHRMSVVNGRCWPSAAQKVSPFYEEWWFLVVVALVGLIFILLLVFVLIIRGQSKNDSKKTEAGRNLSPPCRPVKRLVPVALPQQTKRRPQTLSFAGGLTACLHHVVKYTKAVRRGSVLWIRSSSSDFNIVLWDQNAARLCQSTTFLF